ncbi:hypothetical protein [Domibacillus epiphyticus]|uniref:Uncharacterized protein n=1 Tax=Domibacillus epiphyticus TaxID=1714355 RepID=A0A1V2ABN8_9BACI|nr:hypothetical protein [Domibacillus epiphyticus]OMP68377.1 hypothetical protein BTO28_01790 [Domibacillus epiphyticus]
MEFEELVRKINKHVEELDYFSARKYIEQNIDDLQQNKHLLNSNAREILMFLVDQINSGHAAMTRQELSAINAINEYSYKFDLRGIKMLLKNRAALFMREDIDGYLNKDAKEILTGMGAIKK